MGRPNWSGSASRGSAATGGCAWPTSSSRRAAIQAARPTSSRSSSPPWARGCPWPPASCSRRTPTASTSSCTACPSSSPRRWPSTGTRGSGASSASPTPIPTTLTASSGSATGARAIRSAIPPARTWPTAPRGSGCSNRPGSASSCPKKCSCTPSSRPTPSSSTTPRRSTSVSEPYNSDGSASRTDAVMFDMDGLLVDSEPLWLEAETAVMARLGADWTPADQVQLLGGSLDRTVRYLLGKARRPASPGQVAEWLMSGIVELARDRGVPVRPGARELLAEVEAAGLPHALVTGSERRFMDVVLACTGLRFDALVCADDVSMTKPDPEPYQLAAKLLGADPASCYALEVSPNGVASAEAAGCQVIAVPSLVPIEPAPGRTVVRSLLDLRATPEGISLRVPA